MQSLRSIDLEEVLRLAHYPVIAFDRSGVVRWATAAGHRLLASRGIEPEGASVIAPSVRPLLPYGGKHLRAWLGGTLYAVDFEWAAPNGAVDKFLAVPLGLPEASGVQIAVLMLPPAISGAGIDSLLSADPGPGALAKLTAREREIAVQMLSGSRTALIAEEFGISVNTVRNHLKAIFRKLRVRSQAELVRMLRRRERPSAH